MSNIGEEDRSPVKIYSQEQDYDAGAMGVVNGPVLDHLPWNVAKCPLFFLLLKEKPIITADLCIL